MDINTIHSRMVMLDAAHAKQAVHISQSLKEVTPLHNNMLKSFSFSALTPAGLFNNQKTFGSSKSNPERSKDKKKETKSFGAVSKLPINWEVKKDVIECVYDIVEKVADDLDNSNVSSADVNQIMEVESCEETEMTPAELLHQRFFGDTPIEQPKEPTKIESVILTLPSREREDFCQFESVLPKNLSQTDQAQAKWLFACNVPVSLILHQVQKMKESEQPEKITQVEESVKVKKAENPKKKAENLKKKAPQKIVAGKKNGKNIASKTAKKFIEPKIAKLIIQSKVTKKGIKIKSKITKKAAEPKVSKNAVEFKKVVKSEMAKKAVIKSKMNKKAVASKIAKKVVESEITKKAVKSRTTKKVVGSSMAKKVVESEMTKKAVESEMTKNTVKSKTTKRVVGSKMAKKVVQSEMAKKAAKSKIAKKVAGSKVVKKSAESKIIIRIIDSNKVKRVEQPKKTIENITENEPYQYGMIIWGKLTGHAWWPCWINEVLPNKFVKVTWYYNNTTSTLPYSKISPFQQEIVQKGKAKKSKPLRLAIEYAKQAYEEQNLAKDN